MQTSTGLWLALKNLEKEIDSKISPGTGIATLANTSLPTASQEMNEAESVSLVEYTPQVKSSAKSRGSSVSRIIGRADISPISTGGFSDYSESSPSTNGGSLSYSSQFRRIGLSETHSQFVAMALNRHKETLISSAQK